MTNSLIEQKLQQFEQQHHATVICCADNGSKAWGYDSHKSDDDLKAIFVRKDKTKYLNLFSYEDSYRWDDTENNIDITFYDVSKVMSFIYSGNAQGYEVLHSPLQYRDSNVSFRMLNTWSWSKYLSNRKRLGYHYYGLAQSTYKRRAQGKEADIKKHHQWLYIIRPLLSLQYMFDRGELPELNFEELLHSVDLYKDDLYRIINRIVENKRNAKSTSLDRYDTELLVEWIEDNIEYYKKTLDNYKESYIIDQELEKMEYSFMLKNVIDSI